MTEESNNRKKRVLIVDDEGICMDANPAATDILRLSTSKLIGHHISDCLADRNGFAGGSNLFL